MRPGDIPDNEIPAADPADLIRQYEGWINHIVKRYSGLLTDTGAIDIEDMIQAGNMAILEAQKTYKPDEGSSFASWSYRPVRNAILKLFGYDNPGRKRPPLPLVYLDEPIDEDGEETRLDMIQDPDCITPEEKAVRDSAREEIRTEVRAAVDRIKQEKYRTAVKRIWLDGVDKKTLAKEMGEKVENIRYYERSGRSKMCGDYKLRRLVLPSFTVGLSNYRITLTSAVERAVLWREQQYDLMCGDGSFLDKTNNDKPDI